MRRCIILFIALVLLLSMAILLLRQDMPDIVGFSGKVVGVTDGDTISVMHNGKPEKIRLNGIDCPEQSQAFGDTATEFTTALCFGDDVRVLAKEKDRYGRTIADIVLSDGRILSRELVRSGLAWWYREYSNDSVLQKLETEAKEAKLGLWSDNDPIPPWKCRQQQRAAATD